MAKPASEDPRDRELERAVANGLHNDLVVIGPDGRAVVEPPGESIFDCP
jgi:hypothetical protein